MDYPAGNCLAPTPAHQRRGQCDAMQKQLITRRSLHAPNATSLVLLSTHTVSRCSSVLVQKFGYRLFSEEGLGLSTSLVYFSLSGEGCLGPQPGGPFGDGKASLRGEDLFSKNCDATVEGKHSIMILFLFLLW